MLYHLKSQHSVKIYNCKNTHTGVKWVNFEKVSKAFQDAGLQPELSEIVQRATTDCPLNIEDSDKVMSLISALEELDDVQDVFTNATFPEEYDPVL